MERSALLIIAASLLFTSLAVAAPPDDSWTLLREEDQVSVYSHDVTDSDFDESFAQTVVKAPLSALVALIMDGDNYAQWINKVDESRRVASVSPTEVYTYTYSDAPWPVDDRDAVVLSRVEQDSKTGIVTIRSRAVPDHLPTVDGVVRVPYVSSSWILTPLTTGGVEVSYRVHNDPGGELPSWLTNSLASDQPYYTLINLRYFFDTPNKYLDAVLPYIKETGSGSPSLK